VKNSDNSQKTRIAGVPENKPPKNKATEKGLPKSIPFADFPRKFIHSERRKPDDGNPVPSTVGQAAYTPHDVQDKENTEKKTEYNAEYLNWEKQILDNPDNSQKSQKKVDFSKFESLEAKGIEIFNKLLTTVGVEIKKSKPKARIFLSRKDVDNDKIEYGEYVFKGKDKGKLVKRRIFRFSSKPQTLYKACKRLMKIFVDFAKDNAGLSKDNCNSFPSYIAAGEMKTALYASRPLHERLPYFYKTKIEMIAGPQVVSYDEKHRTAPYGMNQFVWDTASYRRDSRETFKVYRNNLIMFDKLLAGYFHFYIIGDVIFAEEPHGVMDTPNSGNTRARFMLQDRELAKDLRTYFEDYKAAFASEVNIEELFQFFGGEKPFDEAEDWNRKMISFMVKDFDETFNTEYWGKTEKKLKENLSNRVKANEKREEKNEGKKPQCA